MALPEVPEGSLRLQNLHVPAATLGDGTGLVNTTICIMHGQIVADAADAPTIDMRGAIAFPTFVDMHTHLDKGHIWPRSPNPDGSFEGALGAVRADSRANWSAEDVRARMTFSLRCAYAHGTSAIRTHLDSHAPQDAISWGLFPEIRAEWAGKISLQAACLSRWVRIALVPWA
ncbi:MAG: hypothetical protein AAFY31_13505 [Pseudomonadota bacterium]